VAAVGIPALIVIAYLNGVYWLAFCAVLTVVSAGELAAMFQRRGHYVNLLAAVALPVLLVLAAYIGLSLASLLVISFLIVALIIVARYSRGNSAAILSYLGDLAANALPVLYLGLLPAYAILLGKLPNDGPLLVIFVFLTVWGADTAAYFGGRALGKHKLSIPLSPKKTWEGFWSGFAGALVAAIVSKLVFLHIGWMQVLVMSVASCLAGQIGDLFESAIKRHCQVKDSSTIIPGHGGVLDRFDSFIFAAPVVYLLATAMG